jgi:hypothetical protein
VLEDHRIAAKNCLLTTRAAKWATVQVGTGRTVKEVAGELACDWHTVNDAVTTYGKALLDADRKRLNKTTAIGLDETSFVKLGGHHTATRRPSPTSSTTRSSTSCRAATTSTWPAFSTNSRGLEERDPLRCPRHVGHLRRGLLGDLAQGRPGGRSLPRHLARQSLPRCRSGAGSRPNRPATADAATTRSIGHDGHCWWARRNSTRRRSAAASLLELGDPNAEVASPIG